MADQSHPAYQLINAIKGALDGENVVQSVKDAWDRISSAASTVVPDDRQKMIDQMNKQSNDARVERANQSLRDRALSEAAAAKIRAKAAGK